MSVIRGFGWSAVVLAVSASLSCSLDYGEALSKELDKDVPNRILLSFRQTNVSDGRKTASFQADMAEFFDKKQEARLTKLSFVEYNESGETVTEGQADSAVVQTEKKDAQVNGGIYFYSLKEKTKLYAENLSWIDAEKTLRSLGEEKVTVERDSGSSLEGQGFEINFKNGTLSFTNGIRGSVVEKEEGENQPSLPSFPSGSGAGRLTFPGGPILP